MDTEYYLVSIGTTPKFVSTIATSKGLVDIFCMLNVVTNQYYLELQLDDKINSIKFTLPEQVDFVVTKNYFSFIKLKDEVYFAVL